MKRHLLQTILAIILVFCMMAPSVSAGALTATPYQSKSAVVIDETIEYFPNGDYIVSTLVDETPTVLRAAAYNKTGSKIYTLYNKNGNVLWQFTLKGTFSVNPGVSATCTATSYSINIVDTAWQNDTASTSRSGNQAIGDATFIRKVLLIKVETKSCHTVLTCDKNGNLS